MSKQDVSKEENQSVINDYRSLMRIIKDKVNVNEKRNIRKAFNLAINSHKDTRRQSGKLYISHPISVANEEIYFSRLEKKSRSLLLRAENYLEKGITIARRQNWKGEETQALKSRLISVRIEKKNRED